MRNGARGCQLRFSCATALEYARHTVHHLQLEAAGEASAMLTTPASDTSNRV